MSGVATLAAAALAITLVMAAAAKLRRPERTAADFAVLGLPAPKALARVVPAVELAIALALLLQPGWGGVAAFALLTAFTVLIVGIVRSGEPIACSCFGAVSDEPVSWVEIVRNVSLLALAGLAATTSSLAVPSFEAVVTFSAGAVITVVGLQLAVFKRDVGAVWSTHLAGES